MEYPVSILIIDDDEGMLKTLNYILTAKGYEVVTRSSGVEAIALIKERSFNLILIDIKMPDMNGVETLKEIKRISPDETNIMMITAYTMHKLVGEAKKEGARAILPKPLDIDQLISYADSFKSTKPPEQDKGSESSLLQLLDDRERALQEKSLLIDELKEELLRIKKNSAAVLEQERRKKQSETIHTLLKPKQLELFKILNQKEKSYEEIFEETRSKKLNIRDLHALRLLISRLNKKLKRETVFRIERIRRFKTLYFKIVSG
jgi:DNA-binding response OmpR family regulator